MAKKRIDIPEEIQEQPIQPETIQDAKPDVEVAPVQSPIQKEYVMIAKSFETKWNVPYQLFVAIAGVETNFGKNCKGVYNIFNILASGTENRTKEGYAWYHNVPLAYDHLGQILTRREPYSRFYTEYVKNKDVNKYITTVAKSWSNDSDYSTKLFNIIKQLEA